MKWPSLERASPQGAVLTPHNWGSQVGVLMALHMSKAIKNVPLVEDDRSTCDIFTLEDYQFRDGVCTIPNNPGLAIRVDERLYTLEI